MNGLRQQLLEREPVVGSWLSIGEPAVAELVATLAYDFVLVDMEHTQMTAETVASMARAVDAAPGDTDALVRIPSIERAHVNRILDAGATGLMVPMIHTAEAARTFAERCRYPPDGRRGIAGGRAADYGINMGSYMGSANDEVVTVVQIESQQGLENAEAIAAVEELDAVFVGPADLSAALGMLGQYDAPEFVDAFESVVEAAHDHGLPVATLAVDPGDADRWLDLGADFLMVGLDAGHLREGAQRALEAFDEAVRESR